MIPTDYLNALPSEAETIDWACRSALQRLGFATPGELAAFWDLVTPDEARAWCATELAGGGIIEANVEQADGKWRKAFIRPDTLDSDVCEPTGRMRILSPFDPALRDRKRAERLFGFSYRIEIFVPEPKRQYGYYVFPVMEGDRLTARIDVKAERDRDCLHVRALWPECGVRFGSGRVLKLEKALERTARLAGVSSLSFAPDWLR